MITVKHVTQEEALRAECARLLPGVEWRDVRRGDGKPKRWAPFGDRQVHATVSVSGYVEFNWSNGRPCSFDQMRGKMLDYRQRTVDELALLDRALWDALP